MASEAPERRHSEASAPHSVRRPPCWRSATRDRQAATDCRRAWWRTQVSAARGSGGSAAQPRPHRRPGGAELVKGTVQAMARGGIYDQLGGGFARYSVDASGWCRTSRRNALRQRAAA